jgi:hypothetical protein
MYAVGDYLESEKDHEFCAVSYLIKREKDCFCDKLIRLAHVYGPDIQHSSMEATWLLHDYSVLTTKLDITRKVECYQLEMILSEESIKGDTKRLRYIGVDR